jgi:hypothetical protein
LALQQGSHKALTARHDRPLDKHHGGGDVLWISTMVEGVVIWISTMVEGVVIWISTMVEGVGRWVGRP